MDHNLLGLLGLAKKAGKVVLGEEETVSAALNHRARLILLAADAGGNTCSKIQHAAQTVHAMCCQVNMTKSELGGAVGRSTCAALALTDIGFAASTAKKLAQLDPARWGEMSNQLERKAARTVWRRRKKRARQAYTAQPAKPWVSPPKAES